MLAPSPYRLSSARPNLGFFDKVQVAQIPLRIGTIKQSSRVELVRELPSEAKIAQVAGLRRR